MFLEFDLAIGVHGPHSSNNPSVLSCGSLPTKFEIKERKDTRGKPSAGRKLSGQSRS